MHKILDVEKGARRAPLRRDAAPRDYFIINLITQARAFWELNMPFYQRKRLFSQCLVEGSFLDAVSEKGGAAGGRKAFAKRRGSSEAEVIRDALSTYVAAPERKPPRPKSIGMIFDGQAQSEHFAE